MNTSLTAYTPLETLLLFQSLKTYGVDPSVFSRISDLLKKNPHVRSAKQFDGGRLSPDALRELYNNLVKDEARGGTHDSSQAEQDAAVNGLPQPNPRKRKVPTPTLPSVQDAAHNASLIPRLVERLYARYRAQVTHEIRQEEKRIAELQQELSEIERGAWDEKLQRTIVANGQRPNSSSDNARAIKSPPPSSLPPKIASSKPSLIPSVPVQPSTPALSTSRAPADPATSLQKQTSPAPQAANPTGSLVHPPIHVASHTAPGVAPPSISPQHASPAPTGKSPERLPTQPPASVNVPSSSDGPPSQPAHSAGVPPPQQHLSPYPPQSPQAVSGFAGRPNNVPPYPPPHPRGQPSASPVNGGPGLNPPVRSPYPEGGPPKFVPPAGVASHDFPGQLVANPPRRPLSGQSGQQSTPVPLPPTHNAGNQAQVFPPPSPQTNSQVAPHGVQQANPVPGAPTAQPHGVTPRAYQPPHQGGYMLPPFQVYDSPSGTSQPSTPTPSKTKAAQRGARAPRGSARSTAAGSRNSLPFAAHQNPVLTEALRLLSTPGAKVRPTQLSLSLNTTPSSETRWKGSTSSRNGGPVEPPPVSPILDEAPKLIVREPKGASRASLGSRRHGKEKEPTPQKSDEIVPDEGLRPVQTGRRSTRRTRGASVTSSAIEGSTRGRTRSQSIMSHVDAMSVDNDSTAGRNLKHETSPAPEAMEDVLPGIESAATGAGGRRRRGNTAHSAASSKRKRDARSTSEAEERLDVQSTLGPQFIVAPRHFSKMCQPLMNDITSHKHASLFANPVKERDAEGYRDIIKRPTDLKSIKAAINVGAKVVAAAASADTPGGPNSPGGAGGNVTLPINGDYVPPKGIVNSAQLERELMRMFANAVMFNSGEDGVVSDAREMFEDVQKSVTNWRGAERASDSRDKAFDSDAAGEEEAATSSKRRKL